MRIAEMFLGSFYSAETYRQVRAENDMKMGYALLIVLACVIAVTVTYTVKFHNEILTERNGNPPVFDDVMRQIASQIPVMTYSNDTLTSNRTEPTYIYITTDILGEHFEKTPIATIDTSGATTHTNMRTPVLITATEAIFKSERETKIKTFSEITKGERAPPLVINRALIDDATERFITTIHESAVKFYFIFGGIIVCMATIYFYIARLIMLLILGGIGMLIGQIIKSPITYASAVGCASLSYTPVALLDTFLFAGWGYAPHFFTLLIGGSVTLFAAIYASTKPTITAS